MVDLAQKPTTVRVSSTLNRDTKQFGKQFLTDGTEETCWNSDQGSPQHILLDFGRAVTPTQVRLMFQGGFSGKECEFLVASAAEKSLDPQLGTTDGGGEEKAAEKEPSRSLVSLGCFYPEDTSTLQTFPVACPDPITQLKIVFNSTTDFYGRVTVYTLEVAGSD